MKVLSIRQPYAELIMRGEKWCENRSWHTPHRGPLLIHASNVDRKECRRCGIDPKTVQQGAIIGIVQLAHCVNSEAIGDLLLAEDGIVLPDEVRPIPKHRIGAEAGLAWMLERHPEPMECEHVGGIWLWLLERPERIDAIEIGGKLRLWEFDLEPVAV